ncbi:hypothetical protein K435DRAFT_874801 [Dendrothele bispora CBS 962.96]|uniref:Uncharacterized protein n=1 Tax=Dendrothele bispora (strain CBS 962.96) TaxID=1314807 RepID=A0A4V4HBN3_DENBC|nr:hypothetical protein K435DRAFT_874801 [Dendrothele bispora CBS 962.96]
MDKIPFHPVERLPSWEPLLNSTNHSTAFQSPKADVASGTCYINANWGAQTDYPVQLLTRMDLNQGPYSYSTPAFISNPPPILNQPVYSHTQNSLSSTQNTGYCQLRFQEPVVATPSMFPVDPLPRASLILSSQVVNPAFTSGMSRSDTTENFMNSINQHIEVVPTPLLLDSLSILLLMIVGFLNLLIPWATITLPILTWTMISLQVHSLTIVCLAVPALVRSLVVFGLQVPLLATAIFQATIQAWQLADPYLYAKEWG